MTNQEMNAKVEEIRRLEAQAEQVKQQVDALKDQLKAELDSRKVDNINTGLFNIIYKAYSQKRVDNDKLKAAGLYNEYLKESTYLKFQINDVKVFA